MIESGVMEDYTYLWYDVRPHPNFGTVEIRACDSQTRVEHTLALTALIQAMVRELAIHYEEGKQLADYPWQMLDENKWLAARHGLEGELVDLPSSDKVGTKELARRLVDRLRRARAGPRIGGRAGRHRRSPAARQRREPPARRLRGEPRSSRGHGGDRRRHCGVGAYYRSGWPARLICSSSASPVAHRSAPTSPSARTAAPACASARRRSSARAGSRSPSASAA